MSDGIHFSLDNLPERYRVQVAQKLVSDRGWSMSQAKPPKVAEVRPGASGAMVRKRCGCGSVKMAKGKDGMNRTEARFNEFFLKGKGQYEAVSFKVAPKCRYTPDFVVWGEDGRMECYEVKGGYALPSQNRARLAFLSCREKYPAVRFRWFKLENGGGFVEQYGE